jgi:hypothetical protein
MTPGRSKTGTPLAKLYRALKNSRVIVGQVANVANLPHYHTPRQLILSSQTNDLAEMPGSSLPRPPYASVRRI